MRRLTDHGQSWRLPCLVFCLLFSPLLLRAQGPTYHPWNLEVGLRSTHLSPYYQSAEVFTYLNDKRLALGWEVYLLQRTAKYRFSRIAVGYSSNTRSNIRAAQIVSNPTLNEHSFYQSAFTVEGAYGWELPVIQRKLADRLRFRTGLSLAIQFNQNQVLRVYQENAQDAYGYTHRIVWGGSLWMPAVFLQTQFRLFKGAFVGMECRYGPRFRGGRIHMRSDDLISGPYGYFLERGSSQIESFLATFPVTLGIPSFSLSYSF
jgi:hypothetical protein